MSEQRGDERADYETVEFIHAIAGLPKPPPREEIPDSDAYAKEIIEGLTRRAWDEKLREANRLRFGD